MALKMTALLLGVNLLVTCLTTEATASSTSCLDLFNESGDAQSFIREASELGLYAFTAPVAFRFDTRGPGRIKRAGGFFGNPNRTEKDLRGHVDPQSGGSRNYVSLTLKPDNGWVAKAVLISEAIRGGVARPEPGKPVRIGFEYHIINILGVEPKELGIPKEVELTVRNVPAKNILAYRSVYLAISETGSSVEFGPWKHF